MENQQTNLKQRLSLNKKKLEILLLLFLFLVLGLAFGLKLIRKLRLPEVFEITDADQAYFGLETNKTNLVQGEQVEIMVKLAASANQEFNVAVAVVEWDESKLAYVNATGHLSSNFASSFIRGDQGRRVMAHFVPQGAPFFSNSTSQPINFTTLILEALVDKPATVVSLSTKSDDVDLRFDNLSDTNAVDQNLADQNRLAVSFGAGASPSPSPSQCDVCCEGLTEIPNKAESDWPNCGSDGTSFICAYCPNGVCGLGENCCNCPQDCGSCDIPPSIPPSIPPTGGVTINLRIKFDSVPANDNDMNLPDVNREKEVRVILENNGGNYYYNGLGLEIFSYDSDTQTYEALVSFADLPSGDYSLLIKGPSHRQMRFCQSGNQPLDHVCRRSENISINAGETYDFDFSSDYLDGGDVDWQNGVNTLDWSAILGCRNADARMGSDNVFICYDGDVCENCKYADINFDGNVNNFDIDLLYKTLSSSPDDQ